MNDLLFPEAHQTLDEAYDRHLNVWAFVLEAIDLAHRAFERERDMTAMIVPGVPSIRRVRNDINDDSWRFFRSIAEPLVEDGDIYEFAVKDGGDLAILSDGLHIRLKKGRPDGSTSNVTTDKIAQMSHAIMQQLLFPQATQLDQYITAGHQMDVVYIAGPSMSEYTQIGLRFAHAKVSPFLTMDRSSDSHLQSISPSAFDLIADARERLSS